MDLTQVTEGRTSLLVPSDQAGSGAGPKQAGQAFYNPAMALTRDVTVLAAQALEPPQRPEFLDGLAATGARGLRVATETDDWLVTLNDRARETAKIAERNVERAGLADRVVVRRRDVNALLAEGTWAFIDIDPYGSPVPFLGLAVRAVQDGGLLAVSATDTTALHGVKPKPGTRRYLGEPPPRNAPGWKAAASRYLVGAMIREAARYDRRVDPVLVHHHQHAIRAYVRVREGAAPADEALDALDPVALCPRCQGWGQEECPCGHAPRTGPYYLGALHDVDVLGRMSTRLPRDGLEHPSLVAELLDRLEAEAPLGPFPLDVDRAVKARGVGGPPAREAFREALSDRGIETARTHYAPTTLAYEGDPGTVLGVLEELAQGS